MNMRISRSAVRLLSAEPPRRLALATCALILIGCNGGYVAVATDQPSKHWEVREQARVEFLRDLNLLAPVRYGLADLSTSELEPSDAWMCWISEYVALEDPEQANRRLELRSMDYSGFRRNISDYILSLGDAGHLPGASKSDVLEPIEAAWRPYKNSIPLWLPIGDRESGRGNDDDSFREGQFAFYSYKKAQACYYCGWALFASTYAELLSSGQTSADEAAAIAIAKAEEEWFSECEDVIETSGQVPWSLRFIRNHRQELDRVWWSTSAG